MKKSPRAVCFLSVFFTCKLQQKAFGIETKHINTSTKKQMGKELDSKKTLKKQ
jgi:hypothetical protein